MFRRMPGSMNRPKLNLANIKGIAVFQKLMIVAAAAGFLVEPAVLPVGATFIGKIETGADTFGQFARSGEKVGVNVRLGDGRDAHAFVSGDLQIAVDIALRIDDDRFFGLLTSDQISCLGQLVVIDHAEQHVLLLI